MPNIGFKLLGDKELIKTLNALRKSVSDRIMRPAVKAGLKPIQEQAKINTTPGVILSEKATGVMKKAIKSKAFISRKTGEAFGKVFVDRKTIGKIKEIKEVTDWSKPVLNNKLQTKEKIVAHRPGAIAHLVEFGHGGPHPAPAHPFLRPALDSKKNEAFSEVAREAAKQLPIQVAKNKAKGREVWK